MAPFGKYPSQAFIQWDFYQELVDKRFPFWRIVSEGTFEDFTIQYDPENGENWVLVPYVQAEGIGTRRPFAAADGDIEMPVLVLDGRSGGVGSFQLFPLRVSDSGSDGTGVVIGDGGYGNISIPFTVAGFGYTNEKGNGDLAIPFIQVASVQGALGAIALHQLTVLGYGFSGQRGNGSVLVPIILLEDCTGRHSCVGNGSLLLSVQQVAGIGTALSHKTGAVGGANLILGVIRVSGLSYARQIESSDIVLNYESERRYI